MKCLSVIISRIFQLVEDRIQIFYCVPLNVIKSQSIIHFLFMAYITSNIQIIDDLNLTALQTSLS